MTSPLERVRYLVPVALTESDPYEDPLFKRWDIIGISRALAANTSFSDGTFDWKFELNIPRQSKLQDAPPFLKISPNPLCPDGMFPEAYFDSGIGGFTVHVANILDIEVEDFGVRISSRDELGKTTFTLDRHGNIALSTTPYSQIPRTK